jgi:hypothetical protein
MAQDVLGKTVRIDDKRYDPKGAKLEVWTKGRHKYLIRYVDPEGKNAPESSKILYINTTGKAEKPNASLSDDEVIKEYLLEIKQTVLFNIEVGLSPHPMCHQILKVIQDPYSNETINKRIYGDGSPYYLNNGCSISIEWLGQKPNPDFFLGTFSNPNDAEKYYRRNLIPKESASGFNKKRGPSRYLRLERDTTRLADGIDRNAAWYLLNGAHKGFNKDGVVILPESPEEDGVIITSGVDNADDSSTLPTSSWVIDEGTVNPINDFDNDGIDDLFEGPFSEGLFRDKSYVWDKKVTIKLPEGVNEEKLVWTNKMDNLQYISNSLPEGSEYNKTILVPTGFTGSNGEPGMRPVEVTETKPIIQYFRSSQKDSNIILEVIERFKSMVISKNGIRDYDLKLCSPDSESCKFIDYISPLEDIKPVTPVEPVAAADAPPVDNGKIKLNIQGLFDIDGTTPGSSQSVFEIKAKTTMPSFLVWTGEIPKTDETDEFDDSELDDEYIEGGFQGEEDIPRFEPENLALSSYKESEGSSQVNNTNDNNSTNIEYVNADKDSNYPIVVTLPKGNTAYSHNTTQGYNLVDSKWYGDLLTSAKAHIDHPTFDIPDTDSGNLGCASWVSMVFYRAFGVSMKTGKAVKAVPKSIGDFGSIGTGELGGVFNKNPTLWTKILLADGQPGDIVNTEALFEGGKKVQSGHIGVVMDTKHNNGSWNIASNSSKGFGNKNDPRGCGKLNYSITTWASVTKRNPTKTFCWRYIGPKLKQGSSTF